jgi:hypothetical protein
VQAEQQGGVRVSRKRPTTRQLFVLKVLDARGPKTAKYMGTRIDVLKRMQERGWVSGGVMSGLWSITKAGQAIVAEHEEAS